MKINEKNLRTLEWYLAIFVTGAVLAMHFTFMMNGGGLWRDEVHTVNLAGMRSLKEVWKLLPYDSFPIFWVSVLRTWLALGFGSDFGLRVLRFIVGILCVSGMWIAARCFKSKFPLFLLLFAGLNPLFIIYGDSMRAWGWGLFWLILEFTTIWRVIESPTRRRIAQAILVAIAAVQSSYYNSVLLCVFCCAGLVVTIRRSKWRTALWIPIIGAVAGLTMLPYVRFFLSDQDKFDFLRRPFDWQFFFQCLNDAISGRQQFMRELFDVRIWYFFLFCAALLVVIWQFLPSKASVSDQQKDRLLYGGVVVAMSVPAYFLFLHKLQFSTSPWYYLSLMMAVALGVEAIFSIAENGIRGRVCRLAASLLVLGMALPPVFPVIGTRMTNVDLIAKYLDDAAAINDLIIVYPCWSGVTFDRYYSGQAPWVPSPSMKNPLQRFDLLRPLFLQPDRKAGIKDVLEKAQICLKSGGNLWIVSDANFYSRTHDMEPAPPPPYPTTTFFEYLTILHYWTEETDYFLQQHSGQHQLFLVPCGNPVNDDENLTLIKVSGWRE